MKVLGIGFGAAVITGIVSGILLRLIMKIIAVVFPHMARGFTIEGTLALVMLGIGFSLANSIIFSFIQGYLPKHWLQKGLIYGTLNLVVYGIPFFLSNPDNDLFGPQAPLGIALFSILFIVGGVLLAALITFIKQWIDQTPKRAKFAYLCFFLLLVPALIMSGGIIFEMFTELIPAIKTNF